MRDFIRYLFDNEYLFYLILVVGGSVAAWLKQRAQQKAEAAQREAMDEAPQGPPAAAAGPPPPSVILDEEVEWQEWEPEGIPPRSPWAARQPAPAQTPPPLPPAAADLGSRIGGKRPAGLDQTFFDDLEDRFDGTKLSVLEHELRTRVLGDITTLGEETPETRTTSPAAWRLASGTWRDAVVLREVLGPPVVMRQDDLPGLSS